MNKQHGDQGFITFKAFAENSNKEFEAIVCMDCGGMFHMYQPSSTYVFCPFCKGNALKKGMI